MFRITYTTSIASTRLKWIDTANINGVFRFYYAIFPTIFRASGIKSCVLYSSTHRAFREIQNVSAKGNILIFLAFACYNNDKSNLFARHSIDKYFLSSHRHTNSRHGGLARLGHPTSCFAGRVHGLAVFVSVLSLRERRTRRAYVARLGFPPFCRSDATQTNLAVTVCFVRFLAFSTDGISVVPSLDVFHLFVSRSQCA